MVTINQDIQQTSQTPAEQWAWCEAIYELVKAFKDLADEEIMLELQIEDVRDRKDKTKESALSALTHAATPATKEEAA